MNTVLNSELETGDLVRMLNGGPEMTVVRANQYSGPTNEPAALCEWYDGMEYHTDLIEISNLEPVVRPAVENEALW